MAPVILALPFVGGKMSKLPPLPSLSETRLGTLRLFLPGSNGTMILSVAVGLPIILPSEGKAAYLFQFEGEAAFSFPDFAKPVEHWITQPMARRRLAEMNGEVSPNYTIYEFIPSDLQQIVNRIEAEIHHQVERWEFNEIRTTVHARTWDFSINPENLEAKLLGRQPDSDLVQ